MPTERQLLNVILDKATSAGERTAAVEALKKNLDMDREELVEHYANPPTPIPSLAYTQTHSLNVALHRQNQQLTTLNNTMQKELRATRELVVDYRRRILQASEDLRLMSMQLDDLKKPPAQLAKAITASLALFVSIPWMRIGFVFLILWWIGRH